MRYVLAGLILIAGCSSPILGGEPVEKMEFECWRQSSCVEAEEYEIMEGELTVD